MRCTFDQTSLGRMTVCTVLMMLLVLGGCSGQSPYYAAGVPSEPEPYSEPPASFNAAAVTSVGFEEQEELVEVQEETSYVQEAGGSEEAVVSDIVAEETEEPAADEAVMAATTVLDAVIDDHGESVEVNIVADGTIEDFRHFPLGDPTRLVLDLPEMKSGVESSKKECTSAVLSSVRFGEHAEFVRVVLDSPKEELPHYQLASHAKGLRVWLGSGFEARDEKTEVIEVPEENTAEENDTVSEGAEPEDSEMSAEAEEKKIGGFALVSVAEAAETTPEQGENTLLAEGSEEQDPAEEETANVPEEEAKDPDDTVTDPETAADTSPEAESGADDEELAAAGVAEAGEVETAPAGMADEGEKVVVALAEEVNPTSAAAKEEESFPELLEDDEDLFAEEEPAKAEEEPAEVERAEEAEQVEDPVEVEPKEKIEPEVAKVNEEEQEEEEPPRYTGEHISLDFKDADIRNILRLIAEVSKLNVVAGEDVEGTVTIRLTDVPWDQALEVILLSNGLGMDIQGNILRVAPMDRINREREKALEARKKAEKLEPLKKGLVPVSYADVKELKNVITTSNLLSSRGSIQFDKRTNTMIVIDIEKNIREIQRMIYELDAPTPQVLIESKIVQINPTYTKELGVTWESGYSTTMDNSIIGIGGKDGVTIDGETGAVTTEGTNIDLAPAVGAGTGGAISFGILNNNFGLFGKIAALEKDEKLEIISSPRIMTLDNQLAEIEQGVDLPYLKLSEEGVTSTEFKKATLALKVTPHVTADQSIQMEVEVKKDQKSAQTGAGGEPGIDTRRAETNVLVRSGSTVVIGGIYEETMTDIHSSVPFFGKLPILGWAFKGTKKQSEKIELIIFITPSIMTIEKAPAEEAVWISEAS